MNELMNDKGVYRTAPATPGLFLKKFLKFYSLALTLFGSISCRLVIKLETEKQLSISVFFLTDLVQLGLFY